MPNTYPVEVNTTTVQRSVCWVTADSEQEAFDYVNAVIDRHPEKFDDDLMIFHSIKAIAITGTASRLSHNFDASDPV